MENSTLRRDLSLIEVVAIGLGTMIGGTIFSSLGIVVFLIGKLSLLSLLINSFIAFMISYNYAKLSARFPSCGAGYSFVAKAFPKSSLLKIFTGYSTLFAYASACSFYAIVFSYYLHSLLGINATSFSIMLVSLLIIAGVVFVNIMGVKKTGVVESIFSFFKVIVLVLIIVSGLMLTGVNLPSLPRYISPMEAFKSVLYGSAITFLGFEGFEAIVNASEESKDERYVTRAIYLSFITVAFLYFSIAMLLLSTLNSSLGDVAYGNIETLLSDVASLSLGLSGKLLVSVCALSATASALNGSLYAVSRLIYAMSRDNILPKSLCKLNEHDVPYLSIIITGALSCLLLFLNRAVECLGEVTSLSFLLVFSLVSFANLKVRHETKSSLIPCLLGVVSPLVLVFYASLTTPHVISPLILWLIMTTFIGILMLIINGRLKLMKIRRLKLIRRIY